MKMTEESSSKTEKSEKCLFTRFTDEKQKSILLHVNAQAQAQRELTPSYVTAKFV
jgi:hypothetical protein